MPDVPDATLLRMIADAVHCGVECPHLPSSHSTGSDDGESSEFTGGFSQVLQNGRARLAGLFINRKAEWMLLPSTKRTHEMRDAIDRRFYGEKSRRTRDFSDDDDDGYDY